MDKETTNINIDREKEDVKISDKENGAKRIKRKSQKTSKGSQLNKEKSSKPKKKRKKRKDKTTGVLLGLSIVSLVMVMAVVGQFYMMESDVEQELIEKGTYINGYNLSGMTQKQAVDYIQDVFSTSSENFNLTLTYKDKTWNFTKEDFEVNSDIFTIVEMSQLRDMEVGSYPDQVDYLNSAQNEGKNINVAFNYIFVGLDDKINEVIKEIEVEPKNSTIEFNPDSNEMFEITKEEVGYKVDKIRLYDLINSEFLKTNQISVEIPMIEVLADVTKEDNNALTHKLSEFTTNVADSTGGRKTNVKLALSKFNGMTIAPGESVSFNKITGPHTLDNGYKMATVIYNSQFVEGVGGGICQASTTLYNALLTAGVQIDEVAKHTLPVKYVPLALDAMVSEYVADLKFTNTSEYPIFIKTSSDENSVYVEIYGHKNKDGLTYKTRSETIKTLSHTGDIVKPDLSLEYTDKVLFKGEYYRLTYPRVGYEARAYLETYKDGVKVDEQEIRHEIYKPQNGIIIEGIEKPLDEIPPAQTYEEIIHENVYNDDFMNNAIPVNMCP